MALGEQGRPVSLAGTGVGSAPDLDITKIQRASYMKGKELVEFKAGNRSTKRHYAGDQTGFIQVELTDFAILAAAVKGQRYTDLTLEVETAALGDDTATGGTLEVDLSHAILAEIGEASSSNENRSPASFTLRFVMDDHDPSESEPTMEIREKAGA